MPERIQKLLATAGLGSRREIEGWIEAGRISVNGRQAKLGDQAGPRDRLILDGKPLRLDLPSGGPARVILYHKPAGEICARRDPAGRATVFDDLPECKTGRWISVGRLDISTSGLLLFTDGGELANALMHPSSEIAREYAVRVLGDVTPETMSKLTRGMDLEDGFARFERVIPGGGEGANKWFKVILREGRKREVRRLWEAAGLRVSRLIRTRFGPLRLPRRLPRGKWRELTPGEVSELYRAAGLDLPLEPGKDDATGHSKRGR